MSASSESTAVRAALAKAAFESTTTSLLLALPCLAFPRSMFLNFPDRLISGHWRRLPKLKGRASYMSTLMITITSLGRPLVIIQTK